MNHRPRKRFGQNFLHDPVVIGKIISAVHPASQDMLFEIGPGQLVIDGPPGQIQKISRYPALPVLHKYLADEVVILMDDAARADEKTIVDMWTHEFPEFEHEYRSAEKGASILRRKR